MLIRYPGSKDKQLNLLSRHIDPLALKHRSIAEPFSGTAAITFDLLNKKMVDKYWINDFDAGMAALWSTVRTNPEELIAKILSYVPKSQDFYDFKVDQGDTVLEKAFRKVVLHQISYSGLGAKAGSPIGGREQKGAYKVDCRWSPLRLEKKIRTCSALLNSVEGSITALSWEDMLEEALDKNYFVYLDPPYFIQGGNLYAQGNINHGLLAEKLQGRSGWLLSYDNAPEVVDMYSSWADVQALDIISHLHHKKIQDIVVLPQSSTTSFAW